MLKFHWWRFNAVGYFWGMFVGIVAALAVPRLAYFENIAPLYAFPPIFAASLLASVVASLLTDPDPAEALDRFYARVRPWGCWGPVAARVCSNNINNTIVEVEVENINDNGTDGGEEKMILRSTSTSTPISSSIIVSPTSGGGGGRRRSSRVASIGGNYAFVKDAFNILVGVTWQTALTLLGICLVLRMWNGFAAAVAVVVGTTLVLKFAWYDALVDFSTPRLSTRR